MYDIITKKDFTVAEMAALIDNSLLVPPTSAADIEEFLKKSVNYGFKVVCVNNSYTRLSKKILAGTDVKIATVVAFPFGALVPDAKAAEAESAIAEGADLIDFVNNVGAIKSGDWDLIRKEYTLMAETCHKHNIEVKVILECCYLTKDEIVKACEIAKECGLDYVKTSTGFGTGAAVLGDVKLMKDTVGVDLGVKAAGPIADYETAVAMLNHGANRLGSRRGVDILAGCTDWSDYVK